MLSASCLLLPALSVCAANIEVDGIYYTIDETSKTAEVTSRKIYDKYYNTIADAQGKLEIPHQVIYDNSVYNVTSIGASVFYECDNLSYVSIPEGVTSIGSSAFAFTRLRYVAIPSSVENIEKDAFLACGFQLSSVVWPRTLECPIDTTDCYGNERVRAYAYDPAECVATADGCIYSKDMTQLLFVPGNVGDNFAVPEGVTLIGENAFKGCTLKSLTIPTTIATVEADAFAECAIERVNFTDWSKWYANVRLGNLNSNPYRDSEAYAGGVKVETVAIADGTEVIPDYINAGLTFRDELELPSSLKRIGAYAFCNQKELYSVIMPDGLEEIGDSAFDGCELLENPVLPLSLKTLGDRAFAGCTSMTAVTVPESVSSLGNEVFAGDTKLERAVLVCEAEELGSGMFADCRVLNKVYLPLQLRAIGDYSFYDCREIDEIALPATLERIGEFAFAIDNSDPYAQIRHSGSLRSIILPDAVKYIGRSAFADQSLTFLTVGAGIEEIFENTFENNKLRVINFAEGLVSIGERAFAGNEPLGSIKLPSTVTTLGANAFAKSYICELELPDRLANLPTGSCGIPSVLTLGAGVKTIAADAFDFSRLHVLRVKSNTPPTLSDAFAITDEQNYNLTMIVNTGRKDVYGRNARWKQIENIIEDGDGDVVIYMTGDYALSEEIRTTAGLMPSQVTRMKVVGPLTETDMRIIKENMISLLDLDISETNITAIPDYQFSGSLLASIKLPKGLTTIGDHAFSACRLLSLSELPSSLTEIGLCAFQSSPLVSVSVLPDALETIGLCAFQYCGGISEIIAGASLREMGPAFEGCTALETVDLSQATNLTQIYPGTFTGCTELENVVLPKSVKQIGHSAFYDTALRDIEFASEVENIDYWAFSDCRRLITANLPARLNAVSRELFRSCPRLVSASLPVSVQNIAANVFNGDNKLATLSCAAVDAPVAETNAFAGIRTRHISLAVPALSYRSYLNAPQWGQFQNIQNRIPVTIDEGIDVRGVGEDEYQELLVEDHLEELVEQASGAPATQQIIARRAARRAAMREGRSFAALFNGAQLQSGNDGSGVRVFINPVEGRKLTSVVLDGREMLQEMEGNSLLLPAGSTGALVIRGEANGSFIEEIERNADAGYDDGVYNLQGVRVADSPVGLAPGLYIVNGRKIRV